MSDKKIYLIICFLLYICPFVNAEYAELRQDKNNFNILGAGSGITQGTGTTGNQFKSAMFFGSAFYGANKKVPQAANGIKIKNTRVGSSFFGRVFQYQFGQVVTPPLKNISGAEISASASVLYWKPKPYNADKALVKDNPEYGRFYWSAGTGNVYATRPGPVDIVWERSEPASSSPISGSGWTAETISDTVKIHTKTVGGKVTETWREENTVFYQQMSDRIIVSGSTIKPPRTIYWSGTKFQGVPVSVPSSRISDIKVVFNGAFPKNVPASEGQPVFEGGISLSSGDATSVAIQTQTLWYSKVENVIKALNKEGRVFVELLGSPDPATGIDTVLGYEIVDVIKSPKLETKKVELGDQFPVLNPIEDVGVGLDLNLIPVVANLPGGKDFIYEHFARTESDRPAYYAIKETQNDTDLLVWWLIEGNQGIRWPERYVRYDLNWPSEPDRYSHYLRPSVDAESEAEKTAVFMPQKNYASIVYQDDSVSERAVIKQDRFYTHLDSSYPVHRALIKYISGDHVKFERVFSWLDDAVKNNSFPKNRITESISEFVYSESEKKGSLNIVNFLNSPRSINETVIVGDRINAPGSEIGNPELEGHSYLAGKIISGSSYNPEAYVNPVDKGFESANLGAIIPVNSIPGKNSLEVLWYRKNTQNWIAEDDREKAELLSEQKGFDPVYWPSVIGNYTIKWPHHGVAGYQDISKGTAIVMASNDGSGPLSSLEAKGSVYLQNNASLPGYNPNEEHALMQGGQLYALRNDLNLTPQTAISDISKELYSSEPYVLLGYTGSDSRPKMRAFRVLQELGDIRFNYNIVAGTILQAPMPLPLMQKLKDNDEFNGEAIESANTISGKPHMLEITLKSNGKFAVGDLLDLRGFSEAGNNGWAYVEEVISPLVLNVTLVSNPNPIPIESITFGSNLIPVGSKNDSSDNSTGFNYYKLENLVAGLKYSYIKGANEESLYNGEVSDSNKIANSSDFEANQNYVIIKLKDDFTDVTADIRPANTSKTIVPSDATYSATQSDNEMKFYYYLSGLIQGKEYEFIKGGNEVSLFNGNIDENPLTENGKFVASKDFIFIKGNGVKKVTAVIREANLIDAVVKTKVAHSIGAAKVRILEGGSWSGIYQISNLGSDTFTIKSPEGLSVIKKGLVFELPNSLPVQATILGDITPNARLQQPADSGDYSETTFMDRKNNIWVYRGPHDINSSPDAGATFKISFYYKTLAGFWFPGLTNQLKTGTVVPYLLNDINQPWPSDSYAPRISKGIKYNAVWPENVPELRPGQTLTSPVFGLPAVRGNTSLKVLYQESEAKNNSDFSVTLHDPTREKVYDLKTGQHQLYELPPEVVKMSHKGKTYFPQLPPHLVDRFFFDPNRGELGQLVLKGEFVDEIVGEDYLLINVLSGKDLSDLKKVADPNEGNSKWNNVILSLVAKVETFKESAVRRGTYVADDAQAKLISAVDLVQINSDETAVDSYALSANGTKGGYVTLIAGDGQAFTPKDEPVQMHVIKVGGPLYRGEAKVILSDNPLAEKVTFMHTGDLAGSTKDFDYDWRMAAPEDGLPPAVSERSLINGATSQISTKSWKHLRSVPESGKPLKNHSKWLDTNLGSVVVQDSNNISSIRFIKDADENVADENQLDTVEISLDSDHFFVVGDFVNLKGFSPVTLNKSRLLVKRVNGRVLGLEIPTIDNLEFVQSLGSVEESVSLVDFDTPGSVFTGQFDIPEGKNPTDLFLSFTADPNLSLRIKINESVVASKNMTSISGSELDTALSVPPNTFLPLQNSYSIDLSLINLSGSNMITVDLWSSADSGSSLAFDLKIEANEIVDKVIVAGSKWLPRANGDDLRSIIVGESADVKALSDNYIVVRYRAKKSDHITWLNSDDDDSTNEGWSRWTEPQLAEGWIKRVLAGINPFSQRATDLFSNAVDTSGSILTQAGKRWEGDVALNMENINDYGLIEIYETVIGRGRMLSIDAGIDYGPANDALLLAAGYINDLYMMLGNEAWADAANPTIGMSTKDGNYGDIATALFAFKGQLPNLLEEELALLRGRDDFLQPGVETGPVYNRLFWNYTRGIDSGEIVYALNYNIQEDNDSGYDGKVNAADAFKMFPQGHGDAYGHYLTALKGYYSLFLDNDFTWVPRTEAVTILGKPVQVDYLDERKFAAAAAALARTGKQVVDLTWRRDYNADKKIDWDKEFSPSRENTTRTQSSTRTWGLDHWASRTGQGALINWVVGNSMLPEKDIDPNHEGIQKIDRSTVPELLELSSVMSELQTGVDNAEAGLNPLGLNEGSVLLDLNPMGINGNSTHFDLILSRAEAALNNAASAFDDTKDLTQLMRGEQDSLADLKAEVAQQELAYKYELIELYGTPYPDDIGPGKTYKQGYTGPDLYHYMYVDSSRLGGEIEGVYSPDKEREFKIDLQQNRLPLWDYEAIRSSVQSEVGLYGLFTDIEETSKEVQGNKKAITRFNLVSKNLEWENQDYHQTNYVKYVLSPTGFLNKPSNWKSKRSSPGEIQMAINAITNARDKVDEEMENHEYLKYMLDREIELFESNVKRYDATGQLEALKALIKVIIEKIVEKQKFTFELAEAGLEVVEDVNEVVEDAIPDSLVVGLANGGQVAAPAEAAAEAAEGGVKTSINSAAVAAYFALDTAKTVISVEEMVIDFFIGREDRELEVKELILPLDLRVKEVNMSLHRISEALNLQREAYEAYRALKAKGLRIQDEREIFRQRTAALTQGIRTRDAAFRVFRNEKLERYKSLQDLASKYAFLAAQSYDYETGLLGTDDGRRFLNKIINSRALGVIKDGIPQFAGSDTGDPGLSGALAEMRIDWGVVKNRLGFNNPDLYSTTASLRSGKHRILPGKDGVQNWGDLLERSRHQNILVDNDVRRYCMQVGFDDGRPVPGLILEFDTNIEKGKNIFGMPLVGGDSQFSSSSFATKIFSVGIALEGYVGMSSPDSNDLGGSSPSNPTPPWLDPKALSKTPYVYLIPVGLDYMRSPALGDSTQVRSWNIQDVAIPLPFNIGGSEYSTKKLWQSSESLTDRLFAVRKHQPFRAVDNAEILNSISITNDQTMNDSNFTNRRLIGRSVWNSKWKIIIPGYTLLDDPEEGLDRFIQTVNDIKIYFNTYSYSGN